MAQDSIKDLTINGIILGFLLTCLLSFAIIFMASNNPTGFDDSTTTLLNGSRTTGESNLLQIAQNSDEVLNITAQTNPEASFLGSKDSVATAFDSAGETRSSFNQMQKLIAWTFTGEVGKMLVSVLGGIFGFLMFYFIVKQIRTGA